MNEPEPRPKDMTPEQLRALPEVALVENYEYTISSDGTVTLPDGRVLRELRGHTLRVPRATAYRCYSMQEGDLAYWRDNGILWMPMLTENGWAKRRIPW